MLIGKTHAHSTLSFDGKLPLEAVQRLLEERGNDFCLMSEHIEGMDGAALQRMLDRYAALPGDRCLMIPGIEIDDLHILVYGVTRAHAFSTYAELAAKCFADGAFVAVSHPVRIRGELPAVILPWLQGVEVWNSRYDGRRNPRPASVALWERERRRDPRLVPLAAIDLHADSDYSGVAVGVEAPRARDAILAAIRRGEHVLLDDGAPVSLAPAPLAALAARASTATFDLARGVHRRLRRMGLRTPERVRRMVKGML